MPPFNEVFGMSEEQLITTTVTVAAVFLLAVVAFYVARRFVLRGVEMFVKRTSIRWDDVILERGIFTALAWLAPALVIYYSAYSFTTETQGILQRLLLVYMQVILVLVVLRFVDAASEIYDSSRRARDVPIKGYVQIVKLIVFLIGVIIIFGTVINKSPWGLLSGLGAVTALVLLVFRDTILSFVASIQLATNDMVRIGDWISFPKYDADGDVIDIALHTVKIQNFDKTITTIPTHRFIEDAFKNWRGMRKSGGRRIKRALHLDMTTIRFLDEELESRLANVELLKEYFQKKNNELAEYNADRKEKDAAAIDRRRLTNIGTFRAYICEYLRAHPQIHQQGMTFLVRQLAPGPDGVGIELYVFSKEQAWVLYEEIQADIMDHLLAVLSEFDLRVFQNPTGVDLRMFARS